MISNQTGAGCTIRLLTSLSKTEAKGGGKLKTTRRAKMRRTSMRIWGTRTSSGRNYNHKAPHVSAERRRRRRRNLKTRKQRIRPSHGGRNRRTKRVLTAQHNGVVIVQLAREPLDARQGLLHRLGVVYCHCQLHAGRDAVGASAAGRSRPRSRPPIPVLGLRHRHNHRRRHHYC